MKKRLDFKKGSGEMLSLVLVLPAILTVIMFMASLIQVTLVRQKLEYATYSVCRSAAITSDYNTAISNAVKLATASGDYTMSICGVTSDGAEYAISEVNWQEGTYIKLTLGTEIEPFFPLFFDDDYSSTVVMMIEQ